MPTKIDAAEEKKRGSGALYFIIILILIAALGWVSYQYYKVKTDLAVIKDPKVAQDIAKKNVDSIVKKLSRLMILPEKETPTVATIADAKSLAAQQPFYNGTENGDMVIVYMSSKQAIIYRPSADKIVKVGPIVVNEQTAKATPEPTEKPKEAGTKDTKSN